MFVGYVVSRRFVFIGPKLETASLWARVTVETIFRLVMLGLTIYVLPIPLEMCFDLRDAVANGSPRHEQAVVTYVPDGGLWTWVWMNVGLKTEDGVDGRYNLFFHPHFPKQDQSYSVVLLPRSKCVLSFELTTAE